MLINLIIYIKYNNKFYINYYLLNQNSNFNLYFSIHVFKSNKVVTCTSRYISTCHINNLRTRSGYILWHSNSLLPYLNISFKNALESKMS